jgi:hypothetical protein
MSNRIEAFCILMCCAWELALKAEIAKVSGREAIYYAGHAHRTLCLRDLAARTWPTERDPVRRNLEFLADLRDNAIHLLIAELQPELARLFQATVLNYLAWFEEQGGYRPLQDAGAGLISLVVDSHGIGTAQIRNKYGDMAGEDVEEFLDRFRHEDAEFQSQQFAVSVDYRLVLTKKASEGDISLAPGERTHGS